MVYKPNTKPSYAVYGGVPEAVAYGRTNNGRLKNDYDEEDEEEKEDKEIPWYRRTYDKVWNEADKLKDKPFYDKYKHSVVSCVGAQDGVYGAVVTGAMGVGKEVKDMWNKIPNQWNGYHDYGGYSAIINDSIQDLAADAKGIYK